MAALPTRGSVFEHSLEAAIERARALAHRHHEPDEISSILVTEGARLENYVKATWFPRQSARGTLNDFINRLPTGTATTILHEVRNRYNETKHDPAHAPRLLDLVGLMERLHQAVRLVNATGLGLTNDIASRGAHRVFWLAAWDHFVGGDTEIQFMFPGETADFRGPPAFDSINIDIRKWSEFVRALAMVGSVREGASMIPNKWMKTWEGEGDFLGALVFEGEYRQLLSAAAGFALQQELLVGLNRGDRADQTWAAGLLACVDVAAVPDGDFAALIRERMTKVYALKADAMGLAGIVDALSRLLNAVPAQLRAHVTGPIWVDAAAFDQRQAGAVALQEMPPVLVDRELRVATKQLH